MKKVTFNLTKKGNSALEEAVELSGSNMTDALNKAVQVYALLLKVEEDGGAVYLREKPEEGMGRLRVL